MTDQATEMMCDAATDAHKPLAQFVGTWSAEVKLWMGPGDPHVATGVMVNTLIFGDRFLREDYKGDPMEGPVPDFEGCGFFGYNTTTRKYEGFWIDTASTTMQTETGDVDSSGKVWTMVGEMLNPQTGQPMKKRTVITVKDNDHHSMETWFAGPDGSEFKGMEINYTRK
ncbi:MAG: DUF1579 domain-containing protein [Planctomycetota bacterium]|jgi:hypothetical protein